MDRDVVSRLVYSMIQFLRNQLETSVTLSEEGAESVEVALQCLETAYGISQDSTHLSVSQPLYDIFQEAVKDEITQGVGPHSEPSSEDKEEAEHLKNEGNLFMREDKFDKALECYTKAIAKDGTNAVYYCNRAASHSKLNNHLEAIEDCKRALRIEPRYSKAYGRMGLAYSAIDKAQEAKECYQKALEVEPDNESYRGNLIIAEEKLRTQTQAQQQRPPCSHWMGQSDLSSSQQQQSSTGSGSAPTNPFAALAGGGFNLGPLGNLAGLASGGSGSGAPDIQGLFNNPGLMNMATQLMSDPNMQNMMSTFLGNITGGAPPPQAPSNPAPPTASSSAPSTTEGSGTTTASPPGGAAGMEALLTAGRQLAEQMQAQHPDLVEQLRTQMNRQGGGGGQGGNQDSQDPPQS